MFSSGLSIAFVAVLISILLIFAFVWYLTSITKNIIDQERQALLLVVVFAFSVLLGIFVVDKIIAFKIEILTNAESASIFSLIKDLSLIVFGFYFGSTSNKKN